MSTSYIPTKEEDLSRWSSNFSTLISATPGAYGLMASDATSIATVVNAFNAALTLATNPATKTKATVADKNGKKAAMLVVVRQYAQLIKRNLGVSNEAKVTLGLTINDPIPTPTPVPTTRPLLNVISATNLQQTLRYNDSAAPDKRGRPSGVKGMLLMVAVSATPPASPDVVPFKALATKQPFEVTFNSADVGKTAYYFGRWYTASGELGPWSAQAAMMVA